MRKEEHLQNTSWAQHSRNSDEGGKRKVNKMRRRKIKKENKEL